MIDPSRITRWRSMATTWVSKTVALMLNAGPRNKEEAWLIGYDAAQFMRDAISDLRLLVPLLTEDQVDDVERESKELLAYVRSHRIAGKLSNVDGRTPEEARAFLRKADDLRGGTTS